MTKESFHTYMNLDVVNNSTTSPQRLVFNMTRTIPFLSNAEDYFLTVARFNLQTSNSLPVFIPDILTDQNDPNLTAYTITLYAYSQETSQVIVKPITYIPSDTTQPVPSPPTTSVDRSSSYYWVYNVNDWVAMLNIALTDATVNLNNTLKPPVSITAPYIQYDLTTGLFTLAVSQSAVTNYIFRIYFNPSLYNILPFPAIYSPIAGLPSTTLAYRINVQNSIPQQSTSLVGAAITNFLNITTEFSPLSLMCPIRNIYFATNLLPIEPLLTQPPKVFNDTTLSGGNVDEPGITNVLTDFEINITPSNNYNGEISYIPPGEYRWIDLTQGMNLNKLDLSVFWKDKNGNSFPIYLPVGCSANVKLLFRSKRFYLGYNY